MVVDTPSSRLTESQREVMAAIPFSENRYQHYCERRHKNYGHTCRHQAWERAKGEYLLYVDDDDYFTDAEVLQTLDCVAEPWAVFPILRHGELFFSVPPRIGTAGTGMFIHKKEIGRWPDSDAYEADGIFVEELVRRYPYQTVNSRPLVIQPKSSYGVANVESWFGRRLADLRLRWLLYRDSVRTRIIL